jgi:hypothetical protein
VCSRATGETGVLGVSFKFSQADFSSRLVIPRVWVVSRLGMRMRRANHVLRLSFLGGVTRTLNISYLKAIPVGKTSFDQIITPFVRRASAPALSQYILAPSLPSRVTFLTRRSTSLPFLPPLISRHNPNLTNSKNSNPKTYLTSPPNKTNRYENPHSQHRPPSWSHHGNDTRPND